MNVRWSSTPKRWAPVRDLLAKAVTDTDVLEALSTPGAGAGSLEDLWLDSADELWDKSILRISLRDISMAVMISEGVALKRKAGEWHRRRSPRMTPTEMAQSIAQIKRVVAKRPGSRCSEIAEEVNLDRQRCGKLLVKLRQSGELRAEGSRAATTYFVS